MAELTHKRGYREFLVAIVARAGRGTTPVSRKVSGRPVVVPGYEQHRFFIYQHQTDDEKDLILSEESTGKAVIKGNLTHKALAQLAAGRIGDYEVHHNQGQGHTFAQVLAESKPVRTLPPEGTDPLELEQIYLKKHGLRKDSDGNYVPVKK